MKREATQPIGPDEPSLESLLQHAPWLQRFTRALVKDGGVAEEIAQETWLRAAEAAPPRGSDPRPWLASIARNALWSRRRRESNARHREEDTARREAQASHEEDLVAIELQRQLLGHLEDLPAPQRRAIHARYYESMWPRQIAAREGVPVATVHSRIKRGLEVLRSRLDESQGGRHHWAVALAPLSIPRGATESAAGIGAAFVATTAIAGASIGLWMWWSAPAPPGAGHTLVEPDLAAVAAINDTEITDLAKVSPLEAARESTALGTDKNVARVRVVDANGEPVVGAEVLHATLPLRTSGPWPGVYMAGYAVERAGEHSLTDESGVVELPLDGRARSLFARSPSGAVTGSLEPNRESVELELIPSHPLVVRVVGSSGEAVSSEVEVAALIDSTVRFSKQSEGAHLLEARRTWDGVATFHPVPRSKEAESARDQTVNLHSIDTVHVHGPGMTTFAHELHRAVEFDPDGRASAPVVVEIPMPDLGVIEVHVVDSGGKRVTTSGTATLQAARSERGRPRPEFETEIVDGVARWNHVALGGHPFELKLDAPDLGAVWSTQIEGPWRSDTSNPIEVPLPALRTLKARLLDAAGEPFAGQTAQFRSGYGARPTQEVTFTARSVTAADGQVIFDLADAEAFKPPYSLSVVGRDQRTPIAMEFVDVSGAALEGRVELGDVALAETRKINVTVHVQTVDGEPVPEAFLALDQPGASRVSARTNDKGEARIKTRVATPGHLRVGTKGGPYLRTSMPFDPPEGPRGTGRSDLVVTLERGVELVSTFDNGGLDAGRFFERVIARPRDHGPEGMPNRWADGHVDGNGEASVGPLRPGLWDVEVRLPAADVPVLRIDGVRLSGMGPFRETRLQGIRMRDMLREVQLDDSLLAKTPVVEVLAPDSDGALGLFHRCAAGKTPYAPASGPFALLLTTKEGLVAQVNDAHRIEGPIQAEFGPSIKVSLTTTGAALQAPPTLYMLRGVAGSSAEGATVYVRARDLKKGPTVVQFPVPGRYSVHRHDLRPTTLAEEQARIKDASPPQIIEIEGVGSGGAHRQIAIRSD